MSEEKERWRVGGVYANVWRDGDSDVWRWEIRADEGLPWESVLANGLSIRSRDNALEMANDAVGLIKRNKEPAPAPQRASANFKDDQPEAIIPLAKCPTCGDFKEARKFATGGFVGSPDFAAMAKGCCVNSKCGPVFKDFDHKKHVKPTILSQFGRDDFKGIWRDDKFASLTLEGGRTATGTMGEIREFLNTAQRFSAGPAEKSEGWKEACLYWMDRCRDVEKERDAAIKRAEAAEKAAGVERSQKMITVTLDAKEAMKVIDRTIAEISDQGAALYWMNRCREADKERDADAARAKMLCDQWKEDVTNARNQRDAALKELSEIKSKLAELSGGVKG